MNPLHRFVLASYGHALALLDEKLPADGAVRAECGELQLAFSADETKRIDKLAALNWPEHVLRPVDASEASRLAGITLPNGGLWFPAGGWVVPPEMCIALTKSAAILLSSGCRVDSLTSVGGGWRAEGKDQHNQTWVCQAEIAVICTGPNATSLQPSANLPLTPVRGQITMAPSMRASENLRAIVCASGYLTPSVSGFHLVGATHRFNDEETDVRIAEHVENLSRLAEISPELGKAGATASLDSSQLGGRASVRASVPGAMPLVGELLPRLYSSLGHGTRGLITAGLSGEVIAAAACGQLLPLPLSVLAALAPAKRVQSRIK
jgi:tRNA 5-methylaminomethyl-2-thiouridine biosynthesis bifunctional protein